MCTIENHWIQQQKPQKQTIFYKKKKSHSLSCIYLMIIGYRPKLSDKCTSRHFLFTIILLFKDEYSEINSLISSKIQYNKFVIE